ncbi:MAG: transglutaminase domain-containing protein [Lachnospiraceae bacterium]
MFRLKQIHRKKYNCFLAAALAAVVGICSGCSGVSSVSFSDQEHDAGSFSGILQGESQSCEDSPVIPSFLPESETSLLGSHGYCYGTLSEEEQVVYEEIYTVLTRTGESCRLSSSDSELVKKVYYSVLADHPEIFWVDGYRLDTTRRGDQILSLEFSMKQTMDSGEIAGWQDVIGAYLEEFTQAAEEAGLNSDSGDYDRIRFTFDYIVKHTEYNEAADYNQNICSVFGEGQSVCQGYSVAMQYLLLYQGISSITVSGTTKDTGTSHAWNLVKADGSWYYLDVTWGDPSYAESQDTPDNIVNYSYFCVTGEDISRTHVIGSDLELPECTAVDDNYFVHENCYFTEWDEEQFVSLLSDRMKSGEKYLSIRCSDADLYGQLQTLLISDRKIFDYLESCVSRTDTDVPAQISYFQNKDFNIITFIWE